MNDERLSEEVKAFYSWKNGHDRPENVLGTEDGLLDWKIINAWMRFNGSQENIEEVLSNYESCHERIPDFNDILTKINALKLIDEALIEKYSHWSNRSDEIRSLWREKSTNFVILEQILVFSAVLEFSLGNIFYTVKKVDPPHLFKDLLKSATIEGVFKDAMPFIRYVLGTPRSLNLRNIAWHGFLTVNYCLEVHSKLLLLIILTLGRDLGDFCIHERLFSSSSIEKFSLIAKNCALKKPNFPENNDFYTHLQQLLAKNYYGRVLQLLLIHIEAHVRELFAKVNPKFDPKARIDGYYFTLDMILDQNVCVGSDFFDEKYKNRVTECLSDPALALFYDCFVSLKGPRIRDRMSHGEVPLKDVTKEVIDVLFYLFQELQNDSTDKNPHFESYFHPISELKRKIKELEAKIPKINDLETPEELNLTNFEANINFFDIELSSISILRDSDFAQISKFVRILIQIVENCLEAVINYQEAIEKRLMEYQNRTLSQPRRKTLVKMLEIRPKVVEGVVSCEKIVLNFCRNLIILKENARKRPKMLNEMLKIVENLKVLLSIDKNDWKKASFGLSHLILLSNKLNPSFDS